MAYLSLGSNLGDRKASLQRAIGDLRAAGLIVKRISPVYETEPVGFADQPWFLNIAVAADTSLTPQELLACCQEIEARHGRVRPFPGASRVLDIDILLMGGLVIDTASLQVPHPRMAQRRFVLHPLAQIAPEVLHPVLGLTIASLLEACSDPARVTIHSELGV
jgi:2-amino-4-hydroxy-6-hydroxymethyldihydropteridine diphosphokinase